MTAKMQPFWWFLKPVKVTYGYTTWSSYVGYDTHGIAFMMKALNFTVPKVKITKMQCAFGIWNAGTVTCYGIITKGANIIAYTKAVTSSSTTIVLIDLPIEKDAIGNPISSIILEGTYHLMVRMCNAADGVRIGTNGGAGGAASFASAQLGSCEGYDTSDNFATSYEYCIAMVGTLIG